MGESIPESLFYMHEPCWEKRLKAGLSICVYVMNDFVRRDNYSKDCHVADLVSIYG